MDRRQAEQLTERIQREIPEVIASLKRVTWVGGQTWAVSVAVRSSGLPLGDVESPEDWDKLKSELLKQLRPNN